MADSEITKLRNAIESAESNQSDLEDNLSDASSSLDDIETLIEELESKQCPVEECVGYAKEMKDSLIAARAVLKEVTNALTIFLRWVEKNIPKEVREEHEKNHNDGR